MNPKGKNIVVYDVEIKKNPKDCTNGWKSFTEFGISVACAFDYLDGRYRVFMDDNLSSLVERLNAPGTLIVGFNHISFDNEVLRGSGLPLLSNQDLLQYDMLVESRIAAVVSNFEKGFKLQDHLSALGLRSKTGSGALAPDLYKEKKRGELVDYCLNDVTTEKELFDWICDTGMLACAYRDGNPYRVRRPEI